MREILFRGKSANDGNWVQGSLVVTTIEPADGYPIKHYHIEDMTIGVFPNEFQSGLSETVVPETIGQFTGRSDKNGKKIFEGDILNFDGTVYICYWNNGNLEFGLRNNEESVGMAYMAVYDAEVIGNIHDNPELLEV